MEYKGKLYGRLGGDSYFPLHNTTEDWEKMEKQLAEQSKLVSDLREALRLAKEFIPQTTYQRPLNDKIEQLLK